MNKKTAFYHEVRLYIGSVRGYNGTTFTESELTRKVQAFQIDWNDRHGWTVPLRFSKTTFVCMDYSEGGYEMAAICYPRFPVPPADINTFMRELQRFLIVEFGQNRVSCVFDAAEPDGRSIEMLERPNAEQSHK